MTANDPAAGYLGSLGALVQVYANPSMPYSPGVPERAFRTTVEGKLRVQIKPVGRRSWQLHGSHSTGPELGALLGFATGEWGQGPFVWVPPAASRMNLLTPEVASCGPAAVKGNAVSMAGPLALPVGAWAGRSLLNATPSTAMHFGPGTVPVIPGMTVTASAILVGAGARCGLVFYDTAGSTVHVSSSAQSGVDGIATRLSVTAVVPAKAVACAVTGTNTKQGARPALTWTDRLHEWAPGQGCSAAIVETVAVTALKSSIRTEARRDSDISFTIREVG